MGEEWSDKDNALPAAEAQAFTRALSCFGLGRYLYDTDGEWIELDQHGMPKRIPKLPRWATPEGWLAGLVRSLEETAKRWFVRMDTQATVTSQVTVPTATAKALSLRSRRWKRRSANASIAV
jgi:hypothetical protein